MSNRRLITAPNWFETLETPGRYAVAGALVLVATAAAEVLAELTGSNRVAGAYTVAVLVISYLLGSGPGYAATVASWTW